MVQELVDFITQTSDYSPFSTTLPFNLKKIINRSFIFFQTPEIQIACLLTRFCLFSAKSLPESIVCSLFEIISNFNQIYQLQGNLSSSEQFLLHKPSSIRQKRCWDKSKFPLHPSGMFLKFLHQVLNKEMSSFFWNQQEKNV